MTHDDEFTRENRQKSGSLTLIGKLLSSRLVKLHIKGISFNSLHFTLSNTIFRLSRSGRSHSLILPPLTKIPIMLTITTLSLFILFSTCGGISFEEDLTISIKEKNALDEVTW